jgi:hypothetical protein
MPVSKYFDWQEFWSIVVFSCIKLPAIRSGVNQWGKLKIIQDKLSSNVSPPRESLWISFHCKTGKAVKIICYLWIPYQLLPHRVLL